MMNKWLRILPALFLSSAVLMACNNDEPEVEDENMEQTPDNGNVDDDGMGDDGGVLPDGEGDMNNEEEDMIPGEDDALNEEEEMTPGEGEENGDIIDDNEVLENELPTDENQNDEDQNQ